jgi:hypothetical protein
VHSSPSQPTFIAFHAFSTEYFAVMLTQFPESEVELDTKLGKSAITFDILSSEAVSNNDASTPKYVTGWRLLVSNLG